MGEEGVRGAAGREAELAFVWFPQNPGQRGGSDRKGQARLRLPGWPGARSGRGPEPRGRCSEAASCATRAGEGAEAKAGSPGCASPPADRSPGAGALQATLKTWGWGVGMSLKDLGPNEEGGRGSCGDGWRLVGPSLQPGLHIMPWVLPRPQNLLCVCRTGLWTFLQPNLTSVQLRPSLWSAPTNLGPGPTLTRDDEVVGCGHSVQPSSSPEICGCPIGSTSRKRTSVKKSPFPVHFPKMFSTGVPKDSWDIRLATSPASPVLSRPSWGRGALAEPSPRGRAPPGLTRGSETAPEASLSMCWAVCVCSL